MSRGRRERRDKKINHTLFVFCEGHTEEAYIKVLKSYFKLPSIEMDSKRSKNITSRYILSYKRGKPTHKKDIDYLMYDLDSSVTLDKLNTIKKELGNCELLVSNPCIELWFFLHYENHTAESSCKHFYKELYNRNGKYAKGIINDKLRDKLSNEMDAAIRRAKKFQENKNPSTSVYKFLEKLIELKTT